MLNRANREQTSGNVFSPVHVYKNISDNEGKNGAVISEALEFMKNKGIAKRQPDEVTTKFEDIPLFLFNTVRVRVMKAVRSNLIAYSLGDYQNDKIAFSAQSTDPKAAFALLLAIEHK